MGLDWQFTAAAATFYAAVRRPTWNATQALIVRNRASAGEEGLPGKFRQPEEMKTFQETIVELARSRGVLESALKADRLTGRGYDRVRRVATSIADLEGSDDISHLHGGQEEFN